MTDDIRQFIESLPIEGLVETQVGDFVYAGDGTVSTGMRKFPMKVRIVKSKNDLSVLLSASAMKVRIPFNTKEDREKAIDLFEEATRKLLN